MCLLTACQRDTIKKKRCGFTNVISSCHRHVAFVWEDHRPATGTWKGTAGGNVYSFSGCDDHQTVFDSMVSTFSVEADV